MEDFRDLLGYLFRNPELLALALTHRSFAAERSSLEYQAGHNERLEFLGDAILGLLVSQFLYETYPDASEGFLSTLKGHLVSRKFLARLGEKMDLGYHVKLGRGEERSQGRNKESILAGAMEAVIAALYLDGGWSPLYRLLLPHFREEMQANPPPSIRDAKSRLQSLTQTHFHALPQYQVSLMQGPSHDPFFIVEVRAGGKALGVGEGRSKKEAEQRAAQACLSLWEAP